MSNVGTKTLVSPGDSYFLDLSCPDVKRFKFATDSDIWFKVDLLDRMSRSPYHEDGIETKTSRTRHESQPGRALVRFGFAVGCVADAY